MQNMRYVFSCACSGGAGAAAAHIGCLAAPFTMAAGAGPTAGTLLTITGLGLWWGLRGRFAPAATRNMVFAGSLAGLIAVNGFHFMTAHAPDPFSADAICRSTPLP